MKYDFEFVKLLIDETLAKENISKSIKFFTERLTENHHLLIFYLGLAIERALMIRNYLVGMIKEILICGK